MGKARAGKPTRSATFADLLAETVADPRIVSRGGGVGHPPADGPFYGQSRWVDAAGVEWRVKCSRRSRLVRLINDRAVLVREFNRWTGEVRDMADEERTQLAADLTSAVDLNGDWCDSIFIVELQAGDASEVYVGME